MNALRPVGRLLPILLLAAMAGCSNGPRVVKVSGTVTRHGQPVPNLCVNFEPDNGRPSWAVTDENGRYALSCYDREDGAVTGSHRVYVTVRDRSPEDEIRRMKGELKAPPDQKALLQKYGDRETTSLRFEVKQNRQVIDIALD